MKSNALADELCDIGRRLWQRGYVNGNDGNLSVRLDSRRVLCTPTLISKGFMQPEQMCVVDYDGEQLSGPNPRTSEVLMHLAIYKRQPLAQAVVHCHSPYGTAFAGMGTVPPADIFPEKEVWLGAIALAPYRQSGTPELGEVVGPLAEQHYLILLANHGVVAWGKSIEDAYWRIEVLEGYLRTVAIAAQMGRPMNQLTPEQVQPLLELKRKWGLVDPRL